MLPPSAVQLKTIRDVLTGVVGADAKRGDTVIVETQAFDATVSAEPPPGLIPAPPAAAKPDEAPEGWMGIPRKNLMIMGGAAGAALLALGFLAWRVPRKRKKQGSKVSVEVGDQLRAGKGESTRKLHGATTSHEDPEKKAIEEELLKERQEKEVLGAIKLPEVTSKKTAVLTKHISEEARKAPDSIAHILRTWLSGHEDS